MAQTDPNQPFMPGAAKDRFRIAKLTVPEYGLERIQVLKRRWPAPGLRIHGYTAPLEFCAGSAVEDNDSLFAKPAFQVRVAAKEYRPVRPHLFLLAVGFYDSWPTVRNGSPRIAVYGEERRFLTAYRDKTRVSRRGRN